MKPVVLAVTLIAGVLSCNLIAPAEAGWDGKPIMSGMRNENDPAVQHVRDALMAFSHINKAWPTSVDELAAFARQRGLPLDLSQFEVANYRVATQGIDSVAVFEFKMAGSPTKGAFALVIYIVK